MQANLRLFGDGLRRTVFILGIMFVFASVPFNALHAENYNYGGGAYGADVYNGSQSSSGSSPAASGGGSATPVASTPGKDSTVVTTPSGLEVAINLADGQAIPATGYYITITPINSNGKTFDKAEIYLDGELMYTGTPDATGTLKWLWETNKYPASKVKIVIFGPGDSQSTHEFDVNVMSVHSQTSTDDSSATETLPKTESGLPIWVWAALGLVFIVIVIVLWVILRRRHNDKLPPPMFPPSQPM